MDFDTKAINDMFFWSGMSAASNPFARAVYHAFDDGEYVHPGDPANADPQLLYMVPRLREAFERFGIELPR